LSADKSRGENHLDARIAQGMGQTVGSLMTLRTENRILGHGHLLGMTNQKNCSAVLCVGSHRQANREQGQNGDIAESDYQFAFQESSFLIHKIPKCGRRFRPVAQHAALLRSAPADPRDAAAVSAP
jgi:hypothetical protein